MPQGLKQSSSVVSIGYRVEETGANTFTENQIDLNLSPLDREVFVVLAVNLDPYTPDMSSGNDTSVGTSLTTTSQAAIGTISELNNSNCLATSFNAIKSDAAGSQVAFQTLGSETPPATLEYIGIIATNDFFVQVEGRGNAGAKAVTGKLYGYRAIASADIYAALVQSEVLSA